MEIPPVRPGVPAPPLTPAAGAQPPAASHATLAGSAIPDLDLPSQAVGAARAEFAARQGSLAELFGDLPAALEAPALPPALKAAVADVLARQLPADRPLTAEAMKQAVAQSGLFLESNLAAGRPAPLDLKGALLVLQQALAPEAARAAPRRLAPPTPPPTRDAAMRGEAPAPRSLAPDASPADVVERLGVGVDQALARQALHQLASMPDGGPPHWMLELPLATPQGSAIAQFAIDTDEPRPGEPRDTRAWRARFSLDLPGLGPVHVHLRLGVERTAVAIWAEAKEGLARLSERSDELVRELGAEVAVRPGRPAGAAAAPGRLLDRRS